MSLKQIRRIQKKEREKKEKSSGASQFVFEELCHKRTMQSLCVSTFVTVVEVLRERNSPC